MAASFGGVQSRIDTRKLGGGRVSATYYGVDRQRHEAANDRRALERIKAVVSRFEGLCARASALE